MKYSFLFLLGVLFIVVSCNTEKMAAESEQKSVLIDNLQDFNDQLTYKPTSRGWMDWVIVAYEDAKGAYRGGRVGGKIGLALGGPHGGTIGAVVGGLIVGGAASYGVWPLTEQNKDGLQISNLYDNQESMLEAVNYISNEEFTTIKKDADVNIKLPEEYKHLENVGVLHNGALEIATNHKLTASTDDINLEGSVFEGVLVESVSNNLNNINAVLLDTLALQIVKNEQFKFEYQAVVYDAIQESGRLKELNLGERPQVEDDNFPLADKIMKLFEEAYINYPDKMEDCDFIINRYIEIIESSNEISAEDKAAIYNGFSVAAYTARYWKKQVSSN